MAKTNSLWWSSPNFPIELCHSFEVLITLGNGGLSGTKDWYSGIWCPKCKRLYAETSDGRHFTYLKKDTQKFLKTCRKMPTYEE